MPAARLRIVLKRVDLEVAENDIVEASQILSQGQESLARAANGVRLRIIEEYLCVGGRATKTLRRVLEQMRSFEAAHRKTIMDRMDRLARRVQGR